MFKRLFLAGIVISAVMASVPHTWAAGLDTLGTSIDTLLKPAFADVLYSSLFGRSEKISQHRFVPLSEWWVSSGDQLIIDTQNNVTYIFKKSGPYTMFRVATGRREFVHYAGLYYDASTPNTEWIVKGKETQTDRVTFGKDGTFYRLYELDGKKETATKYGLHSHLWIKTILARSERFESMGCVLLPEDHFWIVDAMLERNGGSFRIKTVDGVKAMFPETELAFTQAGS